MKPEMERTKAIETAKKATQLYLKGFDSAGLPFSIQKRRELEETIYSTTMRYLETTYELIDQIERGK